MKTQGLLSKPKYSIAKPTNPDQENVVAAALASKQTHQYFLSVIFFIPEFIDWWFLDGDDDHGGKQSGNPHENQETLEGLLVVFANVTLSQAPHPLIDDNSNDFVD